MGRILVMDGGWNAEQGAHSDLLTQGERYARFRARQSGGLLNQEASE